MSHCEQRGFSLKSRHKKVIEHSTNTKSTGIWKIIVTYYRKNIQLTSTPQIYQSLVGQDHLYLAGRSTETK